MHHYTEQLIEQLSLLASEEKAAGMKAYMRNQFDFLGIQTPERRTVSKANIKKTTLKHEAELEIIVTELWQLPEREYQYCAIELFAANKKIWTQKNITLIEYCITTKSWWDTVDFIATDWTAPYFKSFPEQINPITLRWNNSENFWLQRTSLLFQKSYKKNTDTNLLSSYILNLASSKEFFIQKAIGWILREYAKTDADWVRDFVNEHELAPLSKREAMKHFN